MLKGGKIPDREGVPRAIREFYREHPFPAFDLREFPTFEHLKGRASPYVRLLDQSIGSRASLLEVGCGTGQLSNYLAHIPTRRVVAVDFSGPALALGARLRDQLGHDNLRFLQADLFGLPFGGETFDYVLCHGVLHHTPDPRRGLRRLVGMLKPGGGLVIGLYHRLGRRRHWRRARRIRRAGGEQEPAFRYRPSDGDENPQTVSSWFVDAHLNPYETGHLLVEAAGWFRENGLAVAGSAPSFEWGAGTWNDRPLFDAGGLSRWRGNRLTFLLSDLKWWVRPVERGYFLLFGRKE